MQLNEVVLINGEGILEVADSSLIIDFNHEHRDQYMDTGASESYG